MTVRVLLLHDNPAPIRRRIESLTLDSTPLWGHMTVDQMLHHVNLLLAESLGEHTGEKSIKGFPEPLVRWAILNLPWGKGAPTRPDILIPQGQRYDFETEKRHCLELFDRFIAKPLPGPWPRTANFPMTGRHWSQLQQKHLNHHLNQFGV